MDAQREELSITQEMSVQELLDAVKSIRAVEFDSEADAAKLQEQKQEAIKKFIDEQVEEKVRYQHIFKTENGSIYFQLMSGESLRIKQNDGKYEIKALCNKIIYLDEEQANELIRLDTNNTLQEKIIGMPIRTSACQIGMTPFEFEIYQSFPINYTESDRTIIIHGDELGSFANGSHIGHKITEIVK